MSTIIQIKRSGVAGSPAELAQGELAYSYLPDNGSNGGDRLYIGTGTETNGVAADIEVIGGVYFTSKYPTTFGTVEASKLLSTDSNSAINTLSVGNSTTVGGTIKFNEGTNNGSHFVALKAPNSVAEDITYTLPGSFNDGQFLTVDSSGNLSFAAIPSGSFTIRDDSSTIDTFTTGQTLSFSGGTGLTSTVGDNEVTFNLDDTAVTPGSYGSSTEIPTFTVDQQGRLTAAGTASISTTLDIAADTGTDDGVVLGTDTLTISGGNGIDTSVSGDTITVAIDNTVATASSSTTFTNKTFDANGTGNSITNIEVADLATGVLDTDLSSVSASDDTLASAKAIKSYVDSQITAIDVDIAGDQGTGAITDGETLTFTGGEGIDTSVTDNTVTISAEDASDTNKGIASFDATDFTVSSGDVTLNAERVQDIAGAMFSSNTETLITATYQDADGTIDLVVDNDLSNYDNTSSGFITATSSDTLQSKTIDSANNTITLDLSEGTLTGTTAEFNTALSDGSFATLAGSETLLNKILTSPTINTATIEGGTIGSSTPVTELTVDQININGNTISTTGSNADISLNPDGTGTVAVNGARITGLGSPTADTDAATKSYVDATVEGLSIKPAVRVAATTNLAGTYNNGTSGVGATLNLGTAATLSIDGVSSWALYDGVLLINQTDATQNGRYFISQLGDGTTDWILTRCTFCDEPSEVESMYIFVSEGTVYGGTGWVVVGWDANTDVIGTDNITFSQFSGAGTYTGGDGLDLTGTTFSVNVDNSTIEINADDLRVVAGGITANELASNAVTTAKILDANITTAKIADGDVTNAKLANSTITLAGDSGSPQAIDLGDTLTVSGGEGIDTSQSGDTLTIAAELATTSNKGVASFSSDNFTVTSGAVTVTEIDGGTYS